MGNWTPNPGALKHGLIEPSKSKWRSSVLLVKKHDRSFKLVCDYRNLNNKVTEKESFPLPRLEDSWDLIGEKKSQYFQSLICREDFGSWNSTKQPSTKHHLWPGVVNIMECPTIWLNQFPNSISTDYESSAWWLNFNLLCCVCQWHCSVLARSKNTFKRSSKGLWQAWASWT